MDTKTLFETKLPQIFQDHPEKVSEIGAKFGFDISGDGGGKWTVDLTVSPATIAPSLDPDAGCIIEASDKDFDTVLSDPDQGMTSLLSKARSKSRAIRCSRPS